MHLGALQVAAIMGTNRLLFFFRHRSNEEFEFANSARLGGDQTESADSKLNLLRARGVLLWVTT